MKFIAENPEEFEEMYKTSLYLHDFFVETNKRLNWKIWNWFYFDCDGKFTFDPWISDCVGLDLEKYPLLNTLAHLYRAKHAHEESGGQEESDYLKKIFYVEKT